MYNTRIHVCSRKLGFVYSIHLQQQSQLLLITNGLPEALHTVASNIEDGHGPTWWTLVVATGELTLKEYQKRGSTSRLLILKKHIPWGVKLLCMCGILRMYAELISTFYNIIRCVSMIIITGILVQKRWNTPPSSTQVATRHNLSLIWGIIRHIGLTCR